MVKFSHIKKHQQFGLKLLAAAVLVGVIFSIWYFSEKVTIPGTDKGRISLESTGRVSIPGDDLRDMKDIYLRQARKLVTGNYSDIQMASAFQFMNYTDTPELKNLDKDKFWPKFNELYFSIDAKRVSYTAFGNQVAIKFQVTRRNPVNGQPTTNSFVRKISFGDYDKNNRNQIANPLLLEDAIISNDPPTNVALFKMGGELPSELKFRSVSDSKITLTDLSTKKGKWKLLFFFPNAFSQICPTECVALMENYKKLQEMNVDVFAISGDLPVTLLAWSKLYFGNLPYTLVSDPDLKLSEKFSFRNFEDGVTYRGTVIVDPTNKIRYIAAQENSVGRDIDEYIRMFAALQAPGLKPANWRPGDPVIMP